MRRFTRERKNEEIKQDPYRHAARYHPDPNQGLTGAQAAERMAEGLNNHDSTVQTKSIKTIVRENVCTLFNLINLILAVLVLAVGSYKNMLFMGVVFCNLGIGIIQEIRAKRTVDRLSLMSEARAEAVRDGVQIEILTDEVVLDDVIVLSSGKQVVTDCILLCGECEVNESFVTGESDAILKREGDTLLAGSFIVSGTGRARVDQVGEGNYISTISRGAKELKGINSEIMRTLKRIVQAISILIIPVGVLLFYNQYQVSANLHSAVVQTVAALVGMIPEGLMLLTSTVLAVSVIRLSQHRVLVQELYCIETLARVDTLCLDKTGTLTEGVMEVTELVPFYDARPEDLEAAIRALLAAIPDHNATFQALEKKYGAQSGWKTVTAVPFSSRAKWSGAEFLEQGTYIAGAAELMFQTLPAEVQKEVDEYAAEGRVLLLAHTADPFPPRDENGVTALPDGLKPAGLVLLRDSIRPNAVDTLRYFAEEGVDIKVISGDSVATVSQIARRTGVEAWDKAVDASTLQTEDAVKEAAAHYTVFGRVSPIQKKQLVRALKEAGHTVAMTGDGVNDVLALKESDCSVAMAAGSEAARNISQLVLLDSNFDAMPRVVGEGRRSINNVQRSASLFLVKTIYSTLLALLFLFIQMPYPFMPIQLTLISSVTIGVPAFILALEPNRNRVQGKFLENILMRAVPGAAAVVASVLLSLLACQLFHLSPEEVSTMCVLLTSFAGFLLIFQLCIPFNLGRKLLFGGLCAAFLISCVGFYEWFNLSGLSIPAVLTLLVIAALVYFIFYYANLGLRKLVHWRDRRKQKR